MAEAEGELVGNGGEKSSVSEGRDGTEASRRKHPHWTARCEAGPAQRGSPSVGAAVGASQRCQFGRCRSEGGVDERTGVSPITPAKGGAAPSSRAAAYRAWMRVQVDSGPISPAAYARNSGDRLTSATLPRDIDHDPTGYPRLPGAFLSGRCEGFMSEPTTWSPGPVNRIPGWLRRRSTDLIGARDAGTVVIWDTGTAPFSWIA